MKRDIRKFARDQCGHVERDLRRMQRIKTDVEWLNNRDSSCGRASMLTEAIAVLINESIELHDAELRHLKRIAKTGAYAGTK